MSPAQQSSEGTPLPPSHTSAKWPPRIIFNTEGNMALKYLKRLNTDDVTEVFEELAKTSVDVVSVHIGLDDDLSWRGSQHGELWGENMADQISNLFPPNDSTQISVLGMNLTGSDLLQISLAKMIDDGHDIFQLYVDRAKQTGLGIYAFFRMNDAHCNNEPRMEDARRSAMKMNRPDLLIGSPAPYMNKQGEEWNFCWQWDFAKVEVRERFLGLFDETLTRYDVDGLHLDYTRKPPYFKPGQAFKNISTMTEFMRKASEIVHAHANRRNKDIKLTCRVPASIDASMELGIDIEKWIIESLVDIAVVSSPGGWEVQTDISRAVKAADRSGVLIYAGSGGRIITGSPQEGYESGQPSVMRAVALNSYKEGASGLFIYNNDYATFRPQPVSTKDKSDMPLVEYSPVYRELTGHLATDRLTQKELQTYDDLSNPATLECMNRCYYLGGSKDLGDFNRQVPRKLAIIGRGAGPAHSMKLTIHDDIIEGIRNGRIKKTQLRLQLTNHEPSMNRIRCEVNGHRIDLTSAETIKNSQQEQWLVVDNPPVHIGENTILVLLEGITLPEVIGIRDSAGGKSESWPMVHQCEILVICD